MNKATKYLNEHIDGNVFDKPSILEAFSRDRSVLKVTPSFVALPNTTADIQTIVSNANDWTKSGMSLPVTVRGSGMSKTGADLTDGMVISLERLNQVLEIDENSGLVRVQSGTTIGDLKAVLSTYGFTIPVDANPNETVSDLISGYQLDNFAGRYQSIFYYTECLEIVMSNGELLQTEQLKPRALRKLSLADTFTGHLYQNLSNLIDKNFDIIEDITKAPLDFAGYSMISKVIDRKRNVNLMPLFFGADNTLGIISEVIFRTIPLLREPHRMLATFPTIDSAMQFIHSVCEQDPQSALLFDANVVSTAAVHGKKLAIIEPHSKAYYVAVTFDDANFQANRKIQHCIAANPSLKDYVLETPETTPQFDDIDELWLQFINDETVADRPAMMDDVYIPENELADFIADLSTMEQTYKREMPIMGSLTTNCYTVRPAFDLSDLTERKRALEFMKSYATLVHRHHGSITGCTSEGRTKGAFTMLDPRQKAFFEQIKNTFDPHGILNPDSKLGASLSDVTKNLRTSNNPGYTSSEL